MPRFLTIDLGTTLLKFAILDERGSMLALARVKPPIETPQPGRMEMSVARFRETIRKGIAKLRDMIGLDDIVAISFASQANSFVLLDADDAPLTPLILWPDDRGKPYEAALQRASAAPEFRRQTGIPSLGYQFAAAKLLRWQNENPASMQQSPRLLFISDLLTWWFTHEHVTEAGVAGLTGALDIRALTWRKSALPDLGFDRLTLPAVARAGTDLGPIHTSAADEFGLARGCRFVVGCLDQYAGAIGTGTVEPGRICETTGTVLAAIRCSREFRADPPIELFQGPSFDPQLFFEMSFSNTSANLLEHYRNSLEDRPDFAALDALAEHATPGAPHIPPVLEGAPLHHCFLDVKPGHSQGQVTRAIMEAVARQLQKQVRALCDGNLPPYIVSAGGGSRSTLWQKIKAETVGVPLITTDCEEPTSLGAAMLAAHAISRHPLPELARHWVHSTPPSA